MDPRFLAHTDDPDVSKVAAIRVTGGPKSEQVMRAIVHILTDKGPLTPDQIEAVYMDAYALNRWPELTSRSFVQKRVSEMKRHVLFSREGEGFSRGIVWNEGDPVDGAQPVGLTCDYVTALDAVTRHYPRRAA